MTSTDDLVNLAEGSARVLIQDLYDMEDMHISAASRPRLEYQMSQHILVGLRSILVGMEASMDLAKEVVDRATTRLFEELGIDYPPPSEPPLDEDD